MRSLTPSRSAALRYLRSPLGVREVKQRGSPTDCPTIRRWQRCDISTPLLLCVNQPTEVWLCDYLISGSTDPALVKLKYLNACYFRTDDTLPTTELPSGATFLPPGTYNGIVGECDDPRCTICNLYYEAQLCPRQANAPTYRLFFRVEYVSGCGATCYGGFGWYVRPGAIWTQAAVDAIGGVRCDTPDCAISPGGDCCNLTCIPGCSTTTRSDRYDCGLGLIPGTALACCCSADYSFSYNWSLSQETHLTGNLLIPPQAIEQHSSTTSGISTSGRVIGGVLEWLAPPVGGGSYTVHRSDYSIPAQPTDGSSDSTYPILPPGSCLPALEAGVVPAPFGPIFCPGGGPWTTGDAVNFTTVTRCQTVADCFNFQLKYSSESYDLSRQSGPTVVQDYTITIRIGPLGLCGGGCPGGIGTGAGSLMRGEVLAALGAQLWAAGVAPTAFLEF